MGFLNWIKEELCRGSNFPSGNTMQRSNCNGRPVTPKPPITPQPTGSRQHMESGDLTCHTSALLAFAKGWRQAQSLQIPPPGADPVATDRELLQVARPPFSLDEARRALYDRGRSDERIAILRALGVKP
jgi:hypothetical protein